MATPAAAPGAGSGNLGPPANFLAVTPAAATSSNNNASGALNAQNLLAAQVASLT